MRLSAPKAITWLIAIVVGGLGIVGHFSKTAPLSTYSFELVVAGFGLLVLATLLRDL